MATVSDNMRSKAAQDLRDAIRDAQCYLELLERSLNGGNVPTEWPSRESYELLLDRWETVEIHGALTEYIETLAG